MGIFLLMDSGVHLFILRLKDVDGVWPNSALAFSRFLSQIYGSFTLLTALIILEISRKVREYKDFLFILGLWSLFHGIILLYLLVKGFFDSFGDYASLYLYTGGYYIAIEYAESLFLIIFAILVISMRINSNKKLPI